MPQIKFRELSGPTGQSAETERRVQEGNVRAAQQQQNEQSSCPNPPIAPLDHKPMSRAERRREAKGEAPPTKEERENYREYLQELRRKQRRLKKNGWRRRLFAETRGDAAVRRPRAEDREVREDDAATAEATAAGGNDELDGMDEEERAYVAQRMGGSSNASGTVVRTTGFTNRRTAIATKNSGPAKAIPTASSSAAAASATLRTSAVQNKMKRHRVEEEW